MIVKGVRVSIYICTHCAIITTVKLLYQTQVLKLNLGMVSFLRKSRNLKQDG